MICAQLACRAVFLVSFVVSTALKASIVLRAHPFAWAALVVLAAQCTGAPISPLADAVVNAATTDGHQYGRCRLWGAIAWGGVSLASGAIIEAAGFPTAFALYAGFALPGMLPHPLSF